MADDPQPLAVGGALSLPPQVDAHDRQVTARMAGYDWEDYNGFVADRSSAIVAAGYSQREADQHFGWPDPGPFLDRSNRQWMQRLADSPAVGDALRGEGDVTPGDVAAVSGDWVRQDYAQAITDGHAKDANDFAKNYMQALAAQHGGPDGGISFSIKDRADKLAPALAQTLPDHQETTDYAIGLTHDSGVPVTPSTVATTRANMLDQWVMGGEPMFDLYQRAQNDPAYRDMLTQPKVEPPHWSLSDALGRIFDAVKQGAADAYEAPLAGGPDQWRITDPSSPLQAPKVLAYIVAKDVDALARVPAAALQGIARGGGQILQEAGMSEQDADDAVRDALGMAMAVGAKGEPMRVRVIDPIKAPAEAVGERSAAAAYEPDLALHTAAQLRVFHGTPHTFEPEEGSPLGRFSIEKIGTGEGAQAYGHGIYFAESEKVANNYKKNLSEKEFINIVRDTYGEEDSPDEAIKSLMEDRDLSPQHKELLSALKEDDWLGFDYPHQAVQAALREPQNFDLNQRTQAALQNFGNLYQANLTVEPGRLLDLDKTLGEQSPQVQASVRQYLQQENRGAVHVFPENTNARDWLHSIEAYEGSPKAAADALKAAGVHGTRYLDAASRGAGEGTSNYVVFDPDHIEITGRNGETIGPKRAEDLAKGYDAATAVWGQITDMHLGLSLPHAWQGIQMLFRGPQGMIDAAAKAAAKDYAQGIIRKYRTMSEREIAAHFNSVEEYRKAINEHMPEFARWVRQGQMRSTDKPLIANLYDYMENRSAGATLDLNSPFAPVADALRTINEAMRREIEAFNPDMSNFIQDYVTHLWTDRRAAMAAYSNDTTGIGLGRQGTGRSLNKRLVPTISEGLDAGLMPKILDPIENTLHYMAGMSRYIAARKILADSKEAGYIKYATGTAPELGWTELKGAAAVLPAGENAIQRAWAPPGFARSYNNWLDRGVYDHPVGGPIYNTLQYVANATTALRLAFSGYHAVNIAKETMAAKAGISLGEISRGELITGLRDMGYGASMVPGLVDFYRKGADIQKKYLDLNNEDPVVNLLTEAGFRPLPRSQQYGGITSPDVQFAARGASFLQMLHRGNFWQTMGNEARAVLGNPEDPVAYRAAMTGPRAAGFVVNQIGRVIDTLNHPLFDVVIPKVKAGVASDEMEMWLRNNPTATRSEQLGAARKIVDSIDDRFGELNQDNLFWPRWIKQALNLATVSVGWEYGTLRAYGGAAKDVFNGDMSSTRARWMIAYPMMMSFINTLYMRLKSGQFPQSAEDLALPQTGGTYSNRYGTVPERALAPGYEKDAMQSYKSYALAPDFLRIPGNVAGQIMNKMNPFWSTIKTGITGQDAVGHNIYELPDPPFQAWGLPPAYGNFLRYLGQELTPIAAENQMQMRTGTNISRFERWLGFRPAGSFFQNPEGAQQGMMAHERNLTNQAKRRQAIEDSQNQ